ncbi:MAG TPA: nickel-responsive transcriptional regulator NikR [Candidatus Methanomethylicus sp.]|jgi:CopG family nickel-responsive transcriptional regulator|nr:nickel-responsive transcriptional regulator NikR [Caldisericales bacterium]HPC27138.1 nickel-responsive transcriptional regulator NikR [Candidatus Methanomethylicus sp.]HRR54525.1 nickel-responsive transcriptional regulator NikR [Candidatus Methanomethylicus sp.]
MGSKTGVERFSISAPPELVKEFDGTIGSLNQDRSKAIQQAMRLFLSEHNWARGSGECAGAIVLIYDHDVHEVGEELTDIQHHSRSVINSVLHIHIDEKNCLEIIAVRGGVDKLKTLIGSLTACRGVKALKHTIIGI